MEYFHRFDGHLEHTDFRTCVTGAGGCTWPTIPAVKYLITSDNPQGAFGFLATDGILVGRATENVEHDFTIWQGPLNVVPVTFCFLAKAMFPDAVSWQWALTIKIPLCPLTTGGVFGPFSGRCNRNFAFDNMVCSESSVGETGNDLQIQQVEWDQVVPPFWAP